MPLARPNDDIPLVLTEPCVESRTVRDTAAFLAMLEVASDLPPVGLVEGPASARKKIGFFTKSPTGVEIHPEVVAATQTVAMKLEDLGHEVMEIEPPFDGSMLQDFTLYWCSGAAKIVADWEAMAGQKADYRHFESWTYGLIDYYEARRDTLETAIGRLLTFEDMYRAVFADMDLLLSPVLATPPPKIGHLATTNVFPVVFDRITDYVCFTQYQNVAGAPAASLPLGRSVEGLPIGAQLAAAPGNERAILEVAYELEEASPWDHGWPHLYS